MRETHVSCCCIGWRLVHEGNHQFILHWCCYYIMLQMHYVCGTFILDNLMVSVPPCMSGNFGICPCPFPYCPWPGSSAMCMFVFLFCELYAQSLQIIGIKTWRYIYRSNFFIPLVLFNKIIMNFSQNLISEKLNKKLSFLNSSLL